MDKSMSKTDTAKGKLPYDISVHAHDNDHCRKCKISVHLTINKRLKIPLYTLLD